MQVAVWMFIGSLHRMTGVFRVSRFGAQGFRVRVCLNDSWRLERPSGQYIGCVLPNHSKHCLAPGCLLFASFHLTLDQAISKPVDSFVFSCLPNQPIRESDQSAKQRSADVGLETNYKYNTGQRQPKTSILHRPSHIISKTNRKGYKASKLTNQAMICKQKQALWKSLPQQW